MNGWKDFGRNVSVCRDKEDDYWFAKINWSAIGPTSIKGTKLFIKQLQKAVEFAKQLKNKAGGKE